MKKNVKLLIVGGTGFIGRSVAKNAIKRGFQVSIISKNNCPKSKQLKNADYITVDITNKNDLLLALKDKLFCYVLNLSGYINHSIYSDSGSEVFKAHFNGMKNLVTYIDKTNLKGFIQIGSSDEYGSNIAPQNENQRELPISPYSCAKVASTHFLQMLYRTEKFPVVILRLFLVYGPQQGNERFIPQIIKGCLNDDKFPVSHGAQLRDFCYIDDIVEAIFLSMKNEHCFGEVINIASGEAICIKEVVKTIQKLIGFGDPQFGQIPYRVEENIELYADISKANKLLNWSPKITLQDGLEETIKFETDYSA